MSIHPCYAERILSGEKKVEFRRRPLARPVSHIVIYATSPICAVVGVSEIREVICASPRALWESYAAVAGISRSDFFRYFEGRDQGVAFVFRSVVSCRSPLPLGSAGLPDSPPQAFQYLSSTTLREVVKRGRATAGRTVRQGRSFPGAQLVQ